MGGWALDGVSNISGIGILIDGASAGSAAYGGVRADACSAFTNPLGCPNVGWSYALDTTLLADGNDSLVVIASAQSGASTAISRSFVVANHVSSSPVQICIDRPNKESAPFQGHSSFGGWAIANNGPIDHIDIQIDGIAFGSVDYGGARPDVCEMYQNRSGCPNVGWNFALDATLLANGTHSLNLTAYESNGQHSTLATSFRAANNTQDSPARVFIDQPYAGSAITGVTRLAGWAIDDNVQITSVSILMDNAPLGFATYGLSRPDICNAYPGRPGCPAVGWSFVLDTTKLANGAHNLSVLATAADGERSSATAQISVLNWTSDNPLKLSIDTPQAQSGPLHGVAILGRWALSDVDRIGGVGLSIDGLPLGEAIYGGARPDVCQMLPGRPDCPNAGWNYLLDSNLLGDGTHELEVTVSSKHGQNTTMTREFTVANLDGANPINVDIDNPSSAGSTFSGVVFFGGWAFDALSPMTNVSVSIDGRSSGSASYGGARGDVCSSFGVVPGCPNLGWNFTLDTTQLVNGPHMLSVSGTAANGDIGTKSTSFLVQN